MNIREMLNIKKERRLERIKPNRYQCTCEKSMEERYLEICEYVEGLQGENAKLKGLLQEVATNLDSLANKEHGDWPKWAECTIDIIKKALKGEPEAAAADRKPIPKPAKIFPQKIFSNEEER